MKHTHFLQSFIECSLIICLQCIRHCSASVNGVAVAEPYVIVWDMRCLRGNTTENEGAWSIQVASPPLLLHFVPAFSGRAVALSGDGHVALLHVNSNENEEQSIFQVGALVN